MPSARGQSGDGGVSKRMAGQFMTQLQDIKEEVFWVFTANSVRDLHEAFLADDRVDSVVYVHMPGPEQLAAGWRMYLEKFLPRVIDNKPLPVGCETDFKTILSEISKTKKKLDPIETANKIIPSLLCIPKGDKRNKAFEEIEAFDAQVLELIKSMLPQDENWTIARIKSCCRLARKREKPLSAIAKMMPRRSSKLEAVIESLEEWAEEEAIDAETGEGYAPPTFETGNSDVPRPQRGGRGKVRKKVRRLKSKE